MYKHSPSTHLVKISILSYSYSSVIFPFVFYNINVIMLLKICLGSEKCTEHITVNCKQVQKNNAYKILIMY